MGFAGGSPLVIRVPPESAFAAVTVQGGPGTHVLYQDIALPDGKRADFAATIYLKTNAAAWVPGDSLDFAGAANQQFRVDIMNPAAGPRDVGFSVLLNVYRTMPGDTVSSGFIQLQADLTPFAGQTVRIRFAEVDNQGYLQAAVEAVSVTAR
jgi:hypothetical protein